MRQDQVPGIHGLSTGQATYRGQASFPAGWRFEQTAGDSPDILGQELDFLMAFLFVIIGCGMVFSAAGKPGKPSFSVGIKEVLTGPK